MQIVTPDLPVELIFLQFPSIFKGGTSFLVYWKSILGKSSFLLVKTDYFML